MRSYVAKLVPCLLCFSVCVTIVVRAAEPEPSPLAIFEQRIMPIFASPKPSSCVQCHLASVDLKNYILPSSTATFHSLRQHGLVNLSAPRESKILKLIAMGEQDLDAGAKLIHAKTRTAEYEAFAAWLEACCHDDALLAEAAQTDEHAGPETFGPSKPLEVVRHNRKDRLLDSFVRNIWSQRMRCFPCHTPHEINVDNPQHQEPSKRHADYVSEYGQKMNLFLETPEQTLRTWIISSRKPRQNHLPLINVDNPAESLLVLKPTAKLPAKDADGKLLAPSSVLPVSHMGGLKMHVNDHSYKAFVTWISDYAKVVGDAYQQAGDLPLDNWYPTEQFLKVTTAPQDWPVLSTVQLFVFAWDAPTSQWSREPIAFTQALVTPRHLLQGPLFVMVDEQAPQAEPDAQHALPSGKYLIRACVDGEQQLNEQPSLLLFDTAKEYPSIEIDAAWKTGFKEAETIDGEKLK